MVGGPTDAIDHELTESNRALVNAFIQTTIKNGLTDKLSEYINEEAYIEHNPNLTDDISKFGPEAKDDNEDIGRMRYHHLHRILAEGNFVLCVCEGTLDGIPSSFYDLFRVADGKIVEHWDTTEKIAPQSEWKNNNGKF